MAEDPYSLKKDENYVIILSFDEGKMTYTLTRISLYRIDPKKPPILACSYFPINSPLDKIVKNIKVYNYKSNEKLRYEFIENKDELDNLIDELIKDKNTYIPKTKREEAFKNIYNSLKEGNPGFFVYLPFDQFEDNKIEFVFQFDIDLDDYSVILGQAIINKDQQYYLHKNTCRVKELTETEDVDRVTFIAPENNEIWNAKLNKRNPTYRGYTADNRKFVSWKLKGERKVSLKIGFGTSCERLHWESVDDQNWQFILVITAIFLTIALQIIFANFTNCKKYWKIILIPIACIFYISIIWRFYKGINLNEFPLETNIAQKTTWTVIVCIVIVGLMWFVSIKCMNKK